MGRMSVGLAVDFALKGLKVDLIDLKDRSEAERWTYRQNLAWKFGDVMGILGIEPSSFPILEYREAPALLVYDFVFEGLPGEIAVKQAAYQQISNCLGGLVPAVFDDLNLSYRSAALRYQSPLN